MKHLIFIISILTLVCCDSQKKEHKKFFRINTNDVIESNVIDSTKNQKQEDTLSTKKQPSPIPIQEDTLSTKKPPPPIPIVEPYINKPIECFNPNLNIDSAIELVNSGIDNTQWFVVEKRKVNKQKIKLDFSDTILIQKELQKFGWKLIDSIQTNIGNQNKISLKMQKGNRICNIEKTLYLSNSNKSNSIVEEWFEIAKSN